MAAQKHTAQPDKKTSTELNYFYGFLILLGLFSLFCFYKPVSKDYSVFLRTWGFDHITFYGNTVKIAFYALAFVFIIPYTNAFILKTLSKPAEKISLNKKTKLLLFAFIAAISVFVFYLLRVKYYFLGDMNLRVGQTMKQEFLFTEYLTMKLLYYFTSFGVKQGHSPEGMFAVYSCLMGGVFVFFSCLIADILTDNKLQKLLFFLCHTGTALLLVFCGYVEVYSTPIALLSAYIYFSLYYLKNNSGFNMVVLSLLIAIASHLLCVAALPTVFVLYYFKNKSKFKFITSKSNKNIAILLSAALLAALFVLYKVKTGFVLPLSAPASNNKYLTLLSFKHIWEVINGELLCGGISFILVFVLVYIAVRKKIALPADTYFLLSITGCVFLMVFLANLHRGSGDWDILAFTAVSLNLLVASLISNIYKKNNSSVNYILLAIFGLNSLNAFLWIHINHTDKSIKKIESMLVTDPGTYYASKLPGMLQLVYMFESNHLLSNAEEMALKTCNTLPAEDVRSCAMYAKMLTDQNKIDEAALFYEDILQKKPYFPNAYLFLMNYFSEKQNNEKAIYYLTRFTDTFMQQPNLFLSYVDPSICTQIFEQAYNIELSKNNTQKLNELKNVISQLKSIQQQQPQKQ